MSVKFSYCSASLLFLASYKQPMSLALPIYPSQIPLFPKPERRTKILKSKKNGISYARNTFSSPLTIIAKNLLKDHLKKKIRTKPLK